jgi:predicted methyltransferase
VLSDGVNAAGKSLVKHSIPTTYDSIDEMLIAFIDHGISTESVDIDAFTYAISRPLDI